MLAACWVVGICLLQFINHPLWLAGLGTVFAFWLAMHLAGADIMGGSEEFSFSLPATRSELFWARYLFGFIPLVLFSVLGLIAIGFHLPQRCWGLLVDSGLTQHYDKPVPIMLSVIGLLAAPLIYTLQFSCISLLTKTQLVFVFQFVLVTGLIICAALVTNLPSDLHHDLWLTGILAVFVTLPVGLLLLGSWSIYRRKPGISHGAVAARRGGTSLLAVGLVMLVGFIVFYIVIMFSWKPYSLNNSQAIEAERRAMEMQAEAERLEKELQLNNGENK